MVISRLNRFLGVLPRSSPSVHLQVRTATSSKSGALLPEPHQTSFGIIRVILTVIPGLLLGAAMSKNFANFLEENDLFVPSDDDDDDD